MISFVRGKLMESSAKAGVAYVDVNGFGLEINMSQIALSRLPDAGKEVNLCTYFHVREDAMQLFGFLDSAEKKLFCELIGVSGIGPKVALSALSFYEPNALISAIVCEDDKKVAKIPGIGKKTASRIILELKSTFEAQGFNASALGGTNGAEGAGGAGSAVNASVGAGANLDANGANENGFSIDTNAQTSPITAATDALLGMGFTQQEAELALRGANAQDDEGEIVKYALKRLGTAK